MRRFHLLGSFATAYFIAPTSLCNRYWILRWLYGRRATASLLLENVNRYALLNKPNPRSSILVHGEFTAAVAILSSSHKLKSRSGMVFRGCSSAYLASMSANVLSLIAMENVAVGGTAVMYSSKSVGSSWEV